MNALFAAALLHPERGCPPGLRTHNGSDPAVRFDVYRNNVVTSLVGALSDTFGVTRQLVGDEFFAAMAHLFVVDHPPASPVLSEYGDAFPGFIAQFAPAASLPYLPDVARLERARVLAYHAADAPALAESDIAAWLADAQALPRLGVQFHPSAQIVVSDFAIVSLWAAHQGQGDLEQVDPRQPEAALVLRADDDAVVIGVPPVSGAFFQRLAAGATMAAAAESVAPSLDLALSLGILIRHCALTAWRHSLEPTS